MFNMMIAERGILNDYCSWLFDVLFSVFEKIDSIIIVHLKNAMLEE